MNVVCLFVLDIHIPVQRIFIENPRGIRAMKKILVLSLLLLAHPAKAQDQRIGIIDFFGLRHVSVQQARTVLGLHEGDTLPLTYSDIEQKLRDSLHVAEAHLTVVCCDDSGRLILFVGIQENRLKNSMYRSAPHWNISLPTEISDAYNNFFEALQLAISKGVTGDDISQGHSLMADSATHHWQEQFVYYARHNLKILKTVLRNAADPEQRAIAAYVIGYATDKRQVTDDLLLAAVDEDEVVRNNASRALAAIATLAQRRPALRIKISPTQFINMLGSPIWTDRNKALMVLSVLTKKRDRQLLHQLRAKAFSSLVEMARWKSKGHAFHAFLILGRIGGVSERELNKVGRDIPRRNALIDKIVKANRTK
jgi:hypothetical protein